MIRGAGWGGLGPKILNQSYLRSISWHLSSCLSAPQTSWVLVCSDPCTPDELRRLFAAIAAGKAPGDHRARWPMHPAPTLARREALPALRPTQSPRSRMLAMSSICSTRNRISVEGIIQGFMQGSIIGVIEGDTRSLDSRSGV